MRRLRKCKNILVTGGSGFIGSAFIRHLLKKEPSFKGKCINLDLLTYAANQDNLKSVADDPRYMFQKGDIKNQPLVKHLCFEHKIDTIIHFAAESHVDNSISGPQTFIETNVVGTFHLLEAARSFSGIHFHHVSTDEVYGSLTSQEESFKETTSYKPNSPYSASKAASDHLVRAYGKTYNLSVCISNCSNNYGPCQFPEKLIPLMILNCLENKPLPVYGEGKNIRDWLFVDDHAEALYALLTRGRSGETYNIGGGAEWKNIDLVYEIIKILSRKLNIDSKEKEKLVTFVKDRPGHDFRYAIDCSKIKADIGWKPSHTFSDGLEKTVDWYLEKHLSHAEKKWAALKNSGSSKKVIFSPNQSCR